METNPIRRKTRRLFLSVEEDRRLVDKTREAGLTNPNDFLRLCINSKICFLDGNIKALLSALNLKPNQEAAN